MNYWDVEPLTYWNNLLFTYDAPNEPKGWALRGHRKNEKSNGWFSMVILSQGCGTKAGALAKAIEFTKVEIGKDVLLKFEK